MVAVVPPLPSEAAVGRMGLSCTGLAADRLPLCTGDFGARVRSTCGLSTGGARVVGMKGGAVIEAAARSRMGLWTRPERWTPRKAAR